MFRRFRRQKPKERPLAPPPMLPSPYEDDLGIDSPTMPLRAIRGDDGWLNEEPTMRVPPRQSTGGRPSMPIRPPMGAVDPERVARALESFVNAETWDESREIVETHPELLSSTALMLLRSNIVRVAEKVGPGAAQTLSRYLQTLEVAQREGVDFAFDRMPSPQETTFAPDLEAILTRLESPTASNPSERVRLCEAALDLAARDQLDELWAALQRELGLTLTRIPTSGNTERAIEALDAALQIFTQMDYPADWAMTQHYLGLAYLNREQGERSDNIEQAIESLEASLEVRTRDAMPNEWAATQEALGSALYHRQSGSRAENLDRSIAAFEAALQVRSRDKTPFEWATDQLSLGNAYGQRLTGTRMGNIEQAITGFEAALAYFTRENAPDQWALIHHNLGVAYTDRLFGNHAENVERAIDHYEQTMRVQTRDRSPLEWADTKNNLGNALRERLIGDREENRRRAVAAYQDALRIRNREAFLAEHRRTARNLGSLFFEIGHWGEAHDTLAGALASSEALYVLGLGEGAPSARLRDHAELVALDAYCLAKLNRPRDAAQRLELGRARALDEMLERDRLALIAAPAADRLAFERAQARLNALYRTAQQIVLAGGDMPTENLRLTMDVRPTNGRRSLEDLAQERRDAQSTFDAAVAVIRKTRADFLHPPLTFKQIAGATPKQQALVYLATTPQGTLALIVPGGVSELRDDHMLWAEHLTSARIEDLAPRATDDETVIKTQLGQLPRPKVLDTMLEALGYDLMGPLAVRLSQMKITGVTLVPTGRLATLPLHAAPVGASAPVRDAEGTPGDMQADALFQDVISVTYTPSAQRLMMARAASSIVLRSGVAAIGNPQPATVALDWSEHEAEAVAQVANRARQACTLLIRRQASAEAVRKTIGDRAYVHLACASGFHPERPLDSYLELAAGDTLRLVDVLDGQVTMRGVRVLVLSAGQSAVTTVNAPDESIGLAAGMLVGGAAGVVASLWPASDLATLLLMRQFAQHYIAEDQKPAQALRNAQRWLRSLTLETLLREHSNDMARDPDLNLADFSLPQDHPFEHPFYWAGFAFYGV